MKTIDKHPYIYLLLEPDTVLVCRIRTEDYMTELEINGELEGKVYRINSADEFEAFNHEHHREFTDGGYTLFLNDKVRYQIVEIINKQIQKHRTNSQTGPVHIIASESEAGSLKIALGRPKKVIGFPDFFAAGPLWKLHDDSGQTNRAEWLAENINSEADELLYKVKFTNALMEIEDITADPPIYIWSADNANDQIGLRFFLQLLEGKENEIFLINLTEYANVLHTGLLDLDRLNLVYEKAKNSRPLTLNERKQYIKEWRNLADSEACLRLWENGQIIEVPENHYDPFIIKEMEKLHEKQAKKDYIKTGSVLLHIVNNTDEMLSACFLEYRIRHLLYKGVLEGKGIPKSMSHYSVMLR